MARGMARGLLLVCGVAALSWGGAFTGAPIAARRSVNVARAAKKDGPFTPTVVGLKLVMGEQQLVSMRKYFIKLHGDAQGAAIDTYDSDMGMNIMAWFFDQADVDGNGTIDKEELLAACQKLGFNWIDEKQAGKLLKKSDKDKNGVIDKEEFTEAAPKFFKQSTLKLAKENGGALGLMS